MIVVNKEVGDKLAPMVAGLHIDTLEAQHPDEKSSSSDGSSNSQSDELTEPLQIYKENVDISGVPRFFVSLVGGGGFYEFPEDDIELLDWCQKPSRWRSAGKFSKSDRTQIYHVEVEDESCTVKEFLELLKGIGRFIACSVENANLFFAELNKDGAARLKGLDGINDVYRRADIFFED